MYKVMVTVLYDNGGGEIKKHMAFVYWFLTDFYPQSHYNKRAYGGVCCLFSWV